MLRALLEPTAFLKQKELEGDFTTRLAYTEELKDFPFGDVWNYFCVKNNVPVGFDWFKEVQHYEKEILLNRA